MKKKDKELIDELIYGRLEGDSCIETAENYEDDVKSIDARLYSAMRKLNEGAEEMIARLRELNDELKLEHETNYI